MCNNITVHHMDRCIGTLQVHNMHDEPKVWVCAPDFSLYDIRCRCATNMHAVIMNTRSVIH